MARPSSYNFALCQEVCEKVANGQNIKNVLKSEAKYPSFVTWCEWKRNNDELLNLYTRSIQDKAESEDEEIDNILNDLKDGKIDAQTARVIIDTRKWKAAKYYPKMFGDKVDLTSGGDKIQQSQILLKIEGADIDLK
jgi:hypothetical protein